MLITQEVHVFAGPLSADLRLVRPEASDGHLRIALDRVGALAWVQALPEGLDTVVGAGGHELTVVQAQQVALARLVLADRPVAILDEATAEAGSAGARALEQAALRALEGRTGLLVAHRLTQAVAADRVVVLDSGRVVEQGAHDALVAADGPYAQLWAAWSVHRQGPSKGSPAISRLGRGVRARDWQGRGAGMCMNCLEPTQRSGRDITGGFIGECWRCAGVVVRVAGGDIG